MSVRVLAFLILFFPSQAFAAKFSGDYFLKVCTIDRKGAEVVKGGKIACQAYLSGVIDYHNSLQAMDFPVEFKFCIPQGTTLNEIHAKVLAYMRTRAKLHRKFVAAPGVAMALFHLYPCGKR